MDNNEPDLESLFYWFCENHFSDATGELKLAAEKVHTNLKTGANTEENDAIFENISDDFWEFIQNDSEQIFSMDEDGQFGNWVDKWYDYYFVEGTDVPVIMETNINAALHSDYIYRERPNNEIITIKYDTDKISWEKMLELMTVIKPAVKHKIFVNNKEYEQTSVGKWNLKIANN